MNKRQHFAHRPARPFEGWGPWFAALLLAAAWLLGGQALAQGASTALPAPAEFERLARAALPSLPAEARLQLQVGQLDSRLKLAPCQRIDPWWPANQKAWGATRIGLRCVDGPVKWNVYLPVRVQVFVQVPVAAEALPAGQPLAAGHLRTQEIDIAALPRVPLLQASPALGRALARPLAAGQPVLATDLRARQFFASGDVVRVVARGPGFQVAGAGQALSVGMEGQPSRIRTENGRVVTAMPVAERQAEIQL